MKKCIWCVMVSWVAFLCLSSSARAERCVELAWSGGSAGKEVKYVPARLVMRSPTNMMIRYKFRSGRIELKQSRKASGTRVFRGIWRQTNGWGNIFLRFHRKMQRASGYWTNYNRKRRMPLRLRYCRQMCVQVGWTAKGANQKRIATTKAQLRYRPDGSIVIWYGSSKIRLQMLHRTPQNVSYRGQWLWSGGSAEAYLLFDKNMNAAIGYWKKKEHKRQYYLFVEPCQKAPSSASVKKGK